MPKLAHCIGFPFGDHPIKLERYREAPTTSTPMTMGLLVTRVQRHEMGWFCSIGLENPTCLHVAAARQLPLRNPLEYDYTRKAGAQPRIVC